MTSILYNSVDPFNGIAGTPLVSYRDQFIDYGERWGEVTHISLNGFITGYCGANGLPVDGGTYTGTNSGVVDGGGFTSGNSGIFPDGGTFYPSDGNLFTTQQWLISIFNRDFQSLQIIEQNQIILNKPFCKIVGLNFGDSNYTRRVPFTIDIDCYESGFFSGYYGVLEPKNEFNIIQEKDQSIRIEHNLSCRGFNTDSVNSNALQNAKNFIQQFSGFNNQVTPYFISLCTGIVPSLIEVKEGINRLNGNYEVTETYIAESGYNSGVLRYSAQYTSGIKDGLSIIDINGSIKTAKDQPPSLLRSRFSGFNIFTAAAIAYSGATNLNDLNPLYLKSGVQEDQFSRNLTFSCSFNNDQIPNPYIDYKVDFVSDDLTSVTNANFQGTVKGRGELSQRWLQVQNFANNFDVFGTTFGEYVNAGFIYFLNPTAISQSVTKNPFVGEITLAGSYTDKLLPPTGLIYLDYTLSFNPSIEKYSAVPILNGSGQWYISDLGYTNREIVKVNGAAVVDPAIALLSGAQIINNYLNYLNSIYLTGNRIVLEEQNLIQGNKSIGLDIGFDATWSQEGQRYNP